MEAHAGLVEEVTVLTREPIPSEMRCLLGLAAIAVALLLLMVGGLVVAMTMSSSPSASTPVQVSGLTKACIDKCTPTGGHGHQSCRNASYCNIYKQCQGFRGRCGPSNADHRHALAECEKCRRRAGPFDSSSRELAAGGSMILSWTPGGTQPLRCLSTVSRGLPKSRRDCITRARCVGWAVVLGLE